MSSPGNSPFALRQWLADDYISHSERLHMLAQSSEAVDVQREEPELYSDFFGYETSPERPAPEPSSPAPSARNQSAGDRQAPHAQGISDSALQHPPLAIPLSQDPLTSTPLSLACQASAETESVRSPPPSLDFTNPTAEDTTQATREDNDHLRAFTTQITTRAAATRVQQGWIHEDAMHHVILASTGAGTVDSTAPDVETMIANGLLYQCLFHFLACGHCFDNESEWKTHCESHLKGSEAPRRVKCPICREVSFPWDMLLPHIADHQRQGARLPNVWDDRLISYLFNKHLIQHNEYQELVSNRRLKTGFGILGLMHNPLMERRIRDKRE